ncbi:hypothetical protein DLAC_09648 [Tieghemostelium lacteum]|uniref:tRNAHis guanylyltransferase catalytic domain-containing protein n=1 Tax=Tieghemostelium lacteum TaxID=361077 RepID=A0A151Z6T5_TIELA|nr:hypothetical protein DLAC_09648 [Tieghemostelium lacteum]|eukprot:KYQ89681.1 hypothetical protein DLAC_09648 [Tieghemostelium lacteum]
MIMLSRLTKNLNYSIRYYSSVTKFKNIEESFDFKLPPYQPYIIRFDGNSFKKLTKDLELTKPYDMNFHNAMKDASLSLCNYIKDSKLVYSFSDEINVLVYSKYPEDPFLSNRIQKLISLTSSIVSTNFSVSLSSSLPNKPVVKAYFDARVFPIQFNDISEYLYQRQSRCYSNCLNTIIQHESVNTEFHPQENSTKKYLEQAKDYIKDQLNIDLQSDRCKYPHYFQKGFILQRKTTNLKNSEWAINTEPLPWLDGTYIQNFIKNE